MPQNSVQFIRYRDIALQRSKKYWEDNKEKLKEYQRNKYRNLSQEEKKRRVEKRKEWFNNQTKEKQEEMKRKAREYSKNRYHNHIVVIV